MIFPTPNLSDATIGIQFKLIVWTTAIFISSNAFCSDAAPKLADVSADQERPTLKAKLIDYEIIREVPHSTNFFTQGLVFYNGELFESTGHYGRSKIIRYDKETLAPAVEKRLANKYFGEGAAAHQGVIYQLTWRAGTALAYDPKLFAEREGFSYEGEGWGLTSDTENLWMSDGSNQLRQITSGGEIIAVRDITFNGRALNRLNELEWINGKIFSNRWHDNRIYVVDPESGETSHYIDLTNIARPHLRKNREHVLNGVAWNPTTETLWVTGKNWPLLYELKLQNFD